MGRKARIGWESPCDRLLSERKKIPKSPSDELGIANQGASTITLFSLSRSHRDILQKFLADFFITRERIFRGTFQIGEFIIQIIRKNFSGEKNLEAVSSLAIAPIFNHYDNATMISIINLTDCLDFLSDRYQD